MDKSEIIRLTYLAILMVVALYTDLRLGKIYNKLTLPGIVLGVMMNVIGQGWQGAIQSIEGVVLILALFIIFAPVAGIGGGDAKLMMVVGAVLGIKIVVWAMIYTGIAGGVIALTVMVKHRVLQATTKRIALNAYVSILTHTSFNITEGGSKIKFRYSPAIALGTLLACLLNR